MPRMTPELLLSNHSYLNPLKDRELDLRGLQIPAIENLGVTKDSIDSLDLTDNSIRSVINLPKLNRLKHLYLSNNPITFISPNLSQSLPHLNSLVMTNCQLVNFNQLFEILKQFKHLEFLVLIGNPVTKMSFYRDWCIHKCAKVRILDYRRVKDQERKTSLELFYDPVTKAPTDLAKSLSIIDGTNSQAIDQDGQSSIITSSHRQVPGVPGQMGKTLTTTERDQIRMAIDNAETVEEVRRLKRMLEQGFIPKGEKVGQKETNLTPAVESQGEVEMKDVSKEDRIEEDGMQEDSVIDQAQVETVPSSVQKDETMEEEEEETPVTKPVKKGKASKAVKGGGKKSSKATKAKAKET